VSAGLVEMIYIYSGSDYRVFYWHAVCCIFIGWALLVHCTGDRLGGGLRYCRTFVSLHFRLSLDPRFVDRDRAFGILSDAVLILRGELVRQ